MELKSDDNDVSSAANSCNDGHDANMDAQLLIAFGPTKPNISMMPLGGDSAEMLAPAMRTSSHDLL